MWARILRREFAPAAGTLALLGGALGLLVIGASCGIVYVLDAPDADARGGAALVGLFVAPIVALMVIIGSIREKRPGPRAILWSVAALVIAVAGLVLAIAMGSAPDVGAGAGGLFFLAFCAPVALVLFVPSIYYWTKAWPNVRVALRTEREERAVAMVETRGEVTFAELAQELGIEPDRVDDLLDGLLQAGRLSGTIDRPRRRVFSAQTITERRHKLLAIVQARGKVHLDDLAVELHAPIEMIREWIYQLVQRQQFTGYINWAEGLLYSAEAQRLRDGGRCPHCSGQMSLAGKGVIHCPYCGAEVFL